MSARIVVRRAKEPLSQGFSRATRRGGLVIRSGRAAHETTLRASRAAPAPGTCTARCSARRSSSCSATRSTSPGPSWWSRSTAPGSTSITRSSRGCIEAIDRVLRPIVAAEERRAGAHLIGAPRAVTARDQVGLRALNDLLKAAFDQPGNAAAEPGRHPRGPAARATRSEQPGQIRSCPGPHPRASRRPPRRRPRLGRCGSSSRRCGFTQARSAPSRCSPTPSSSRPGLAWRSRPTPA